MWSVAIWAQAMLAQVRKIVHQLSFFDLFVEPLGGFTSFVNF